MCTIGGMDSEHLKLRGHTWYARLAIPHKLQATLGKSELVVSLKTRDLREANRLKHRALAQMQQRLTEAVSNVVGGFLGRTNSDTARQRT